jgi:hypothetical protein
MQEGFRARRRRRTAIAAIAAAVVVVFSACETDPATNVTHNAATLNGKGKCYAGLAGQWQYQLRNVSVNGGWFFTGNRFHFHCSADTGYVPFTGERIGGLPANTRFQVRIWTRLANGETFTTDSVGTKNGTNYDAFKTPLYYPTSVNYGGANHSVDTVGELSGVVAAMNASSASGATALRDGLSPQDKQWAAQRLRNSSVSLVEQDVPTDLGSTSAATAAELARVGSSPAAEAEASAAGLPGARCRPTQSKRFRLVINNLPDLGWISMRAEFCYNPRTHRAAKGDTDPAFDYDIERGWAFLGYEMRWGDDFDAIHDWNGWPQGQVNIRRDFDIVFCAAWGLTGCDDDERGKIVTFGRYNGSAVAGVYKR